MIVQQSAARMAVFRCTRGIVATSYPKYFRSKYSSQLVLFKLVRKTNSAKKNLHRMARTIILNLPFDINIPLSNSGSEAILNPPQIENGQSSWEYIRVEVDGDRSQSGQPIGICEDIWQLATSTPGEVDRQVRQRRRQATHDFFPRKAETQNSHGL